MGASVDLVGGNDNTILSVCVCVSRCDRDFVPRQTHWEARVPLLLQISASSIQHYPLHTIDLRSNSHESTPDGRSYVYLVNIIVSAGTFNYLSWKPPLLTMRSRDDHHTAIVTLSGINKVLVWFGCRSITSSDHLWMRSFLFFSAQFHPFLSKELSPRL